jgi:hypothetical protein
VMNQTQLHLFTGNMIMYIKIWQFMTSKLITTGLGTCFISEEMGTEGATFTKTVSFTS